MLFIILRATSIGTKSAPSIAKLGRKGPIVCDELECCLMVQDILKNNLCDDYENDLYIRVVDEKAEGVQQGPGREKDGEHKYVRFDFIIRFLMEQLMENKAREIDTFITTMKLNQISKADTNISSEEFQTCCSIFFESPENQKSLAWQEHAFAELLTEPNADKLSFEKLAHRLIPVFTNNNYAKDFYLKAPSGSTWIPSSVKDKDPAKDKKGSGAMHNLTSNTLTVKEATLISLQPSSRYHTIFQTKNHSSIPPALLNAIAAFYDNFSSAVVLLESYEIFRERIENVEKASEQLEFLHEEFREDLSRLPQGININLRYDFLTQYNQVDFMLYLESCWRKLRLMLGMVYRTTAINT